MDKNLVFLDSSDLADFSAFLKRALRLDVNGAVKLRAFGQVLAAYVSPIYAGSLVGDGLTVIGLRTMNLASKIELDGLYSIEQFLLGLDKSIEEQVLTVSTPPTIGRIGWAGVTPPRQGWVLSGEIDSQIVSDWAKTGIAEVAEALPESVGSAIAARVRLQIWGKAVGVEHNFPAGSAFAMAGLGFLQKGLPVKVFRAHGWIRLTSEFGHVLARESFKFS
ncbi:MAG: hypothetical protein P8M68_00865 [Aquiluna sp.]|nr:hypothetical protein [Aquiluna sp.]